MKKILFVSVPLVALALSLGLFSFINYQHKPALEKKDYPKALFTPGKMASIELEMPEETWQDITTKASDKKYHECTVTINGERFDHVAIRTKGASSLDDVKMMKSERFSFTLKLNKYVKGQKYHGLTKLLLNNNIWETRHNELAFLYVKVGVQGKGIGQTIWKAIEALHPETEVWETCTPYFDRHNIHFYINCCGFHAVEFFHAHHPDPHMPEQFDQEDGLFRFEKCK